MATQPSRAKSGTDAQSRGPTLDDKLTGDDVYLQKHRIEDEVTKAIADAVRQGSGDPLAAIGTALLARAEETTRTNAAPPIVKKPSLVDTSMEWNAFKWLKGKSLIVKVVYEALMSGHADKAQSEKQFIETLAAEDGRGRIDELLAAARFGEDGKSTFVEEMAARIHEAAGHLKQVTSKDKLPGGQKVRVLGPWHDQHNAAR